jgi:tripartite-type tricarboxylate transporter receptor subunit TctC
MIRYLGAVVVAVLVSTLACAQGYPARPVHVLVGATPGSTVDVMARLISQRLSEQWGERIVVENRAGAGGSIASAAVAKSPADGYTLLWHSNAFAVNPALHEKLPYDALRDFVAIAAVAAQPFVLVASPAAGLKTVPELISAAKARPGQLTFASVGNGSATHFAAEKFRIAAGIDATHVPYKGGPEANADVIAARVTYWFAPIAIALPHVRTGKFVAIAVSSARRSAELSDVPTIAESGLSGFEYTFWNGLWAPAGTDAAIVAKISSEMGRLLASRELHAQLAKLGAEPMTMTPADFAQFVRSEMDDAKRLAKAAGISAQ